MAKAKDAPDITCIYCRKRKPPSREHALQRALGGDLTFPDVCEGCNTSLSVVDDALASNSFLSLIRVGTTPRDAFPVKLGGDSFVQHPSGVTLEVAIRNQMQPDLYPQIHILLDGSGAVHCPVKDQADFERLVRFVERRIASGQLKKMFVKIGPPEAGPMPRLVLHRDGDKDGFVRAQSASDAEEFFARLESQWPTVRENMEAVFNGSRPATTAEIKTPIVQIHQRINVNDVYRAVAKVAFEVLAANRGSALALDPIFDGIREYIRGADVRLVQEAPDQVAIDPRFVTSLPRGTLPVVACEAHAVTIFAHHDGLRGWVTPYETFNFLVQLSETAPVDFIPLVHEFSADRSGNGALGLEEIVRRLRERGVD